MVVLSFNCRGFAIASKKLALKTLFHFHCPDFIMLQETLGVGEEIKLSLKKMLLGWTFMTIYAKGRPGGLDLGVKYCSVKLLNPEVQIWYWGLRSIPRISVHNYYF